MIIRAPRVEINFYHLDKKISEDARLGWAARGLLIYLLGKHDNWKISIANLCNQTKESTRSTGTDGVYGLLNELISVGYIQRVKSKDSNGRFKEVNYFVSETPVMETPVMETPLLENPLLETPLLANTALIKNDINNKGFKQERMFNNDVGETAKNEAKTAKTKATNSANAPSNKNTGTRLQNDWTPSPVDIQFCAKERPDLNVMATADSFRDYWISKPGVAGKKLDWAATWRNWVRAQHKAQKPKYDFQNPPKYKLSAAYYEQHAIDSSATVIDGGK